MSPRQNSARVVGQEKQCNTLDDAGQGQLDIDDNRIELAAAPSQRIHAATGNRPAIMMSRLWRHSPESFKSDAERIRGLIRPSDSVQNDAP